jgi:hypothetical protein
VNPESAGEGFPILVSMNNEKSLEHLGEIKNVLQDFVERWEIMANDEKKHLQERAKEGLGHIDGVIGYVHSVGNE